MKKDSSVLVLAHLSQLLDVITGFGGFIVPLIIWLTQKDRIDQMDAHGKSIINFQISMLIYMIICIPLILLFGLGIVGLIVLGVIYLIYPIVNAVRASNGQQPSYPLSLNIIG
ncbi:DUF4870 domain-containing protein [Aquimarina hainanensis]|uniref:DUF4870 domain-containing protein n=1 Tax=Aquimarina hainanensis TaxID=1578017 RepID=A0ABW5NG01_9FLAO|nr:DUF4870 domain-containing protein [Aquimarina sp. TRL1]QKX07346.1 DUF4870 domain-containing protein [Aquimarina sp. TRL1]